GPTEWAPGTADTVRCAGIHPGGAARPGSECDATVRDAVRQPVRRAGIDPGGSTVGTGATTRRGGRAARGGIDPDGAAGPTATATDSVRTTTECGGQACCDGPAGWLRPATAGSAAGAAGWVRSAAAAGSGPARSEWWVRTTGTATGLRPTTTARGPERVRWSAAGAAGWVRSAAAAGSGPARSEWWLRTTGTTPGLRPAPAGTARWLRWPTTAGLRRSRCTAGRQHPAVRDHCGCCHWHLRADLADL